MTHGEFAIDRSDKTQQRRAVDFMLSEPTRLYCDTYIRSLLREGGLYTKLETIEDEEERGKFLANLLSDIPQDNDTWIEYGASIHHEEAYDAAGIAILAVAASSEACASVFRDRLDTAEISSVAWRRDDSAGYALSRTVGNMRASPAGVRLIGDMLAPQISDNTFRSLLQQRIHAPRSGTSISQTHDEGLVSLHQNLQGLLESGLSPAQRDAVVEAMATINETANAEAYKKLVNETSNLVTSFTTEPQFETLSVNIDAIHKQDPELAEVLRIRSYSRLISQRLDSPYTVQVQEALDSLIQRVTDQSLGPMLSEQLQNALISEIMRRAKQIAPKQPDFACMSEQDLASFIAEIKKKEYALLPSIDGVIADTSQSDYYRREVASIISRVEQQIQKEFDRRHTLLEYGFESAELPEKVVSVEYRLAPAVIRYNDIREIISDIELYFLYGGKREEKTARDTTEILDSPRTAALMLSSVFAQEPLRIFESIQKEMIAWAAGPKDETFKHSKDDDYGTPYKHAGGAFSGSAIRVAYVDGKYALTIGGGGYSYNAYSPSQQLEEFAEGLNIVDRMEYLAPPEVSIAIQPSKEELAAIDSIPPAGYMETGTKGAYMYEASIHTDIAELVNYYGKVVGIDIPHDILSVDPDTLRQINDTFAKSDRRHTDGLTVSWKGEDGRAEGLTITGINATGWCNGTRVRLHEDGTATLPITVHTDLDDKMRRNIQRPGLKLTYQGSISTEQINAMVARVRKLTPILDRRTHLPVGSTGWQGDRNSIYSEKPASNQQSTPSW